jgi:hypothetical protein
MTYDAHFEFAQAEGPVRFFGVADGEFPLAEHRLDELQLQLPMLNSFTVPETFSVALPGLVTSSSMVDSWQTGSAAMSQPVSTSALMIVPAP